MEKNTAKPPVGTWDRLPMTDEPRTPKVTFDVNIIETVTFTEEKPRENISDDGGVYYTFDVTHKGIPTVIQTSAWTLLGELKKHSPLKGKTLHITKKLEKGKQFFVVTA